ncbi:DNA-directed RNA polymerase [Candidatus Woesearchaeota archaeon]|nr:MAG: DNA-directed RNA polymerase [Candidatus Woesearchaeota archaeon]
MFYAIKVKDHVRVPPSVFGLDLKDAVRTAVKEKFTGFISEELGIVIDVLAVDEIGEGIIIPGDGANYYDASFELLSFVPEMQEVLPCIVRDIAEFGAFMNIGAMDGMVHVSQSMNDYVSVTKDRVLQGKETGRVLKIGDKCFARMVAISYKDRANPKFGLTMRQEGLGKEDWIAEDLSPDKKARRAKA